jgi:hypothetical protein
VDGVLFQIHEHILSRELESNDSAVLGRLVALGQSEVTLSLQDASTAEFESFLKLAYLKPLEDVPVFDISEWTAILKVSHQWSITRFHAYAIKQLDTLSLPAVDKLLLGRRYDVPSWIQPAFRRLCEQGAELSDEEGRKLGLEDVLLINRLRGQFRMPTVLRPDVERRKILDDAFTDQQRKLEAMPTQRSIEAPVPNLKDVHQPKA